MNPATSVNGTSLVVGIVNNNPQILGFNTIFDSSITAFGFSFNEQDYLQINADGELVGNLSGKSGFFGFTTDSSFDVVSFTSNNSSFSDGFGIDNIVYTSSSASVPFEFSPGLGLLAVGGVWGLSRLRKRIAASTITE